MSEAVCSALPSSVCYFVAGAFFLSLLSPQAQKPNGMIYLAYVGALILAAGVLTLGVGLIRSAMTTRR